MSEDDGIRTLISEIDIASRVKELGGEISRFYRGEKLLVIPLLRGGFMFAADLVRQMDLDLEIEFLGAASYGNSTRTSGEVKLTLDTSVPIAGRHVLLVEDIVDTGLTLVYIQRLLRSRRPESLRTVVLLNKPQRREEAVPVDWVGFDVPDRFVFGYGLDSPGGLDRNLREIVMISDLNENSDGNREGT